MARERCAEGLAALGIPEPHGPVSLAEARRLPSGLKATLHTVPSWPVSGAPSGWPLSASQSRTVLSSLAEARRLPSGLKATLVTRRHGP